MYPYEKAILLEDTGGGREGLTREAFVTAIYIFAVKDYTRVPGSKYN